MTVKIIGAGLAGSEAAWQLVNRNIPVEIYEMRPSISTKAHQTGLCAELVCSNSLKNSKLDNAAGLMKEEMRLLGSLILEAATYAEVPAGGALAVDRLVFAQYIDEKIRNHPLITFVEKELQEIPESSSEQPVIVATGPLTSKALTKSIAQLIDTPNLAFFDAIAPIFFRDSLDLNLLFKMSRYGKGGDDYYNIPLEKDHYNSFIDQIELAEKYTGNQAVESDSPEELRPFEGCMPIEDIILRGRETLRHGPLKPKGLIDPRTDRPPYAAVQLRQDDLQGNTWSMVGMQTRMKRHEQERIIRQLPGMQNAEFVRYGSFHRNTFIDSPNCLNATLELRKKPGLFFAGQINGTEGYIESAIGGILAGINASRRINNLEPLILPIETAGGSLFHYISDPTRKDFQPMNITYGVMPSYHQLLADFPKMNKHDKRMRCSNQALEILKIFIANNL